MAPISLIFLSVPVSSWASTARAPSVEIANTASNIAKCIAVLRLCVTLSYFNRNCLGWATGIELAIDFSGRRLQFSIQESDDSRIANRAVQGRPDCADCGAAGRKCCSESAARRTRAPARIEQFEQRQATVERWAEEAGAGDELARTFRQETGRAEGSQRRDPATGH